MGGRDRPHLRVGLKALRPTFACALSLLLTLWTSQGQAIPLDTLISANGSITQGDKLFNNFSGAIDVQIGAVAPTSNAGIAVQGITQSGNHGLQFSGPFSASVLGLSILNIQYDVSALNPNFLIHDVQVSLSNTSIGGDAEALVSLEALHPTTSLLLGAADVSDHSPQSGLIILSADQSKIRVNQTLVLFSEGGSVSVGAVQVTFSRSFRSHQVWCCSAAGCLAWVPHGGVFWFQRGNDPSPDYSVRREKALCV